MTVHSPLILRLGEFAVSGYGIALASAVALAYAVGWKVLRSRGEPVDRADDLFLVAAAGVIGAKAYEMLVSGALLSDRGGFSYLGGCLVALPALWAISRWRRVSPWDGADLLAIGAAAAVPVARTGCWAIGDDYGMPTGSILGVAFPQGSPPSTVAVFRDRFHLDLSGAPSDIVTVHPTQLYEAALGVLIFLGVWRLREHAHQRGWLLGVFMLATGVERFAIEFLRAKTDRVLPLGLTVAQAVSMVLIVGGALMMQRRRAASAA